eukprot:6417503-Pyramimonas_sp.AAC.1
MHLASLYKGADGGYPARRPLQSPLPRVRRPLEGDGRDYELRPDSAARDEGEGMVRPRLPH